MKKRIVILFTLALIVSFFGRSQATKITVVENPQDSVICGKTYKKIIKLYLNNILAFEKYSEKYRAWQIPVLIAKDGSTIYLENPEERDEYYYADFTPSHSRKFIYMSVLYLTSDIVTVDLPESEPQEILKFSCGIIIDSQTGERLLNLFGADVAGEWNCNDEWVSGGKILFSPSCIQK